MTALGSRSITAVQTQVSVTRAALYLRQSLDHAEGIERQRFRTGELAQSRGWQVAGVFEDNAQSASKARSTKSAWTRMLADIRAGRITHVVAVDLDRLVRSTRDLLVLIDAGAKVVTVDGEIDLSSADGEFRATMLAAIARFEVRRKSERQIRANVHRAERGHPNPGRRRYGYETDGRTPRPAEADIVRMLFEEADAGTSLRAILHRLRTDGVPPGTGTGWTTRRLRDTLNNRHYEGWMLHKGQWHLSDEIEPLVPSAQAERVRAILADPLRKTTPGAEVRHQLSGIARCGVCGSSLLYMRSYRCRADAAHPSITKARLEPLVRAEVLSALLLGPASILPREESGMTANALREALESVRRRHRNVMDAIGEGLTDLASERTNLAGMKAEELDLLARHEALSSASVAAQVLTGAQSDLWSGRTVSIADAARQKVALSARFDSLDLHQQRELIRMLVDVVVNPGRTADRVHIAHRIVTTLNKEVS